MRERARERGMTLIEIMIVIAIIGLVMAVIAVKVGSSDKKAKRKLAYLQMQKLETAFGTWSMEQRDAFCPPPPTVDELKGELGKRKVEILKDPWGGDYHILCGSDAPAECEGMCVKSLGEDHREGTDDDIKSWEPLKS